jgi:hypothetical protein
VRQEPHRRLSFNTLGAVELKACLEGSDRHPYEHRDGPPDPSIFHIYFLPSLQYALMSNRICKATTFSGKLTANNSRKIRKAMSPFDARNRRVRYLKVAKCDAPSMAYVLLKV